MKTKNPREAAYLALLASLRDEGFIADALELWRKESSPSSVDFHFAQQIACGSAQMALSLDYLAEQVSDKKKLSLKLKEKALLRLAFYQYYFLDRIPLYAIADESIKLAHKYCHKTFAGFLNATLRKLADNKMNLPEMETVHDISIRYSYPKYFVQQLIADYGLESAKEILSAGNSPAPTMVRIRSESAKQVTSAIPGLEIIQREPFKMAVLRDTALLQQIVASPGYYIQNITPVSLINKLAEESQNPKSILDLCASPGGKLLVAHDLFPEAKLFANDVSPEKLERLTDNCKKYSIDASIACGNGEEYVSNELFDLIILDVPCSNSGVLNKRPEARWRISKESLTEIERIQRKLIAHASTLLAADGELWYLTCSILKKENETLTKSICNQLGLKIRFQYTQLPNRDGWDGGFACAIRR